MVVASVVVTPVTTPAASTVAIGLDALLQVPPVAVGLVSVICEPEQTLSGPTIAPANGSGFTVTWKVLLFDPQLNVFDV